MTNHANIEFIETSSKPRFERRKFLKLVGLTAAGLALQACLPHLETTLKKKTELSLPKPEYVTELRRIVNGDFVEIGQVLPYTPDALLRRIQAGEIDIEYLQFGTRCDCSTAIIGQKDKYNPNGPQIPEVQPNFRPVRMEDIPLWIRNDYAYLKATYYIPGLVVSLFESRTQTSWQTFFTGYRTGIFNDLGTAQTTIANELKLLQRYTQDPQGLMK